MTFVTEGKFEWSLNSHYTHIETHANILRHLIYAIEMGLLKFRQFRYEHMYIRKN